MALRLIFLCMFAIITLPLKGIKHLKGGKLAPLDKKLEKSIWIIAEGLFWTSGLVTIAYFWKDIQGGMRGVFLSGNPMLLLMFFLPLGALFLKSGSLKGALKSFLSVLRVYLSVLLVLFFFLLLLKK